MPCARPRQCVGERLGENGDAAFIGDVQVRRGVTDCADVAVRYTGYGGSHAAFVEVKYQLVPRTVSVALPIGVAFSERAGAMPVDRELDYLGVVVAPTVLVGDVLVPRTVEVVASSKIYLVFPDDLGSEMRFGFSLGFRLSTDLAKWALHPEVGYVGLDGKAYVTTGIGLSATY